MNEQMNLKSLALKTLETECLRIAEIDNALDRKLAIEEVFPKVEPIFTVRDITARVKEIRDAKIKEDKEAKKASDIAQKALEKEQQAASPESSGGKPIIKAIPGELPTIITQMEDVLIARKDSYKRAGCIVGIGEEKFKRPDGKETTSLIIHEVPTPALVETIASSAEVITFDARAQRWVPADPTFNQITILKGRKYSLRLPALSGVISSPLLLCDGRLIEEPGYDATSGLYFEPGSTKFPPIPKNPTRDDALRALALLDTLVCEFPFVDDGAKAVSYSAMLTAVERRAFDCAPMHAYTAPEAGTGKSYLADLVCFMATGRIAPVISTGRNEEELEKRLDGLLFKGVPVIAIDNVKHTIESARLAQILSQSLVQIRMLGSNKEMPEIVQGAFVEITGNNLVIKGELGRRTVYCSLDAKVERPELRAFKESPLESLRKDRGKYVVAAITIIRAFQAAGCPRQKAEALQNYVEWSFMLRDALLWLGCENPCSTQELIRANDSELMKRKALVEVWSKYYGGKPKLVRQVVYDALEREKNEVGEAGRLTRPDLHDALTEVCSRAGRFDSRALGDWLKANAKRVIGGCHFEQTEEKGMGGVAYWKLFDNNAYGDDTPF
jgi:hypothetical protein